MTDDELTRLADLIAARILSALQTSPVSGSEPKLPRSRKSKCLPAELQERWILLSDAIELLNMPRRTIDRKRLAKVFGKEERYNGRVILSRAAVERYLDQFKVR